MKPFGGLITTAAPPLPLKEHTVLKLRAQTSLCVRRPLPGLKANDVLKWEKHLTSRKRILNKQKTYQFSYQTMLNKSKSAFRWILSNRHEVEYEQILLF